MSSAQWKYDVFISFRGADVRDAFLSHLFHALCQNQILTFKDDNLQRGEDISPTLLRVIEESHVALVIFSQNYANSPWCLDELVKIVDCKKRMGQIVVPIFYHVDPTDVQELTGTFGEAFEGLLGQEFKSKTESWSNALRETAEISGFDSCNVKPESKLITEIVEHILKRVNHALPYVPNDDGFIGINLHVDDIESKLCIESSDVRFLGIWGMGGIGKTTIANKIFDKISSKFERKCFVPNIREKAERCKLDYVQCEIFSELFGREVSCPGRPILLSPSRNLLMRKKVLIVLDDVTEMEQIEFLIGKHDFYSPGSRVIMTSRDKQVLKIGGVDEIYEVKELVYGEALQLLSLHAFKQKYPIKEYTKLAEKVVAYAKGIPLALKVLGSTLHDKNTEEWEDELEKLESMADKKIQNILRISYDELDYMEKQIFLDIACFLKGEDKNVAESTLGSCSLNARIGISRLLDKALITISGNKLDMHDLLQQMGRDIVRDECIEEPWGRSRLWIPQDVYNVLTKDLGETSIKSLSLDISKVEHMTLSFTVFKGMKRLRLLKIYNPYYPDAEDYESFNGVVKVQDRRYLYWYRYRRGLDFLPDELRYLYWYRYPSKSLPLKFSPNNLVQLHLIHSLIEQLCNKNWCFASLILMDLSYSAKLIQIADLSKFPRLEVLCLRGCTSLLEIRFDNKLRHVNLANCKNLRKFSSFLDMKSLNFLSLEDCWRIREFPEIPQSVTCLILNGTAIKQVSSLIGHYSQLAKLQLKSCTRLQSLPSNIGDLKSLEHLDLGACSKLMNLPDSICDLYSLKYLIILNCFNLKELPENLGNLENLEALYANKSGIKKLPSSINLLEKLKTLSCGECKDLVLPSFTGLPSLSNLHLDNCGLSEISDSLGSLKSLCILSLSGNNLEMLPVAINRLSKLEDLLVRDNKRLKYISELPSNLQLLSAENCTGLQSILPSIGANMGRLWWLDVRNCTNFDLFTLRKIMDDVLLKVEKEFPQLVYARDKDYEYEIAVSCLSTGFLFRGGELPERIMYKNENGSDLLVSMRESDPHDFMVVAFCAVVSSADYQAITRIECKTSLVAESGTSYSLCFEWYNGRWPEPNSRNRKTFQSSKHIFFWVSTIHIRCKQRFTAASFRFRSRGPRRSSNRMVKKCGIHLLFCNKAETDPSSFGGLSLGGYINFIP
ncbi:Disease resistance protein (TIR-NBS-LRR class) family [Euphorbia peplus]|nr:Disease resistance protein (TIR-NBS-LRR class) family [Euphorbia peplus]